MDRRPVWLSITPGDDGRGFRGLLSGVSSTSGLEPIGGWIPGSTGGSPRHPPDANQGDLKAPKDREAPSEASNGHQLLIIKRALKFWTPFPLPMNKTVWASLSAV